MTQSGIRPRMKRRGRGGEGECPPPITHSLLIHNNDQTCRFSHVTNSPKERIFFSKPLCLIPGCTISHKKVRIIRVDYNLCRNVPLPLSHIIYILLLAVWLFFLAVPFSLSFLSRHLVCSCLLEVRTNYLVPKSTTQEVLNIENST